MILHWPFWCSPTRRLRAAASSPIRQQARKTSRPRGIETARGPRHRLFVEVLESRTLLSGSTLATATPLTFAANQAVVQGFLNQDTSFYALSITGDGHLTAQDHADGPTRLSLLSAGGNTIMQSDGQSAGNPDPVIDVDVGSGSYYLRIEGLSSNSGNYTLSASYTTASVAQQTQVPAPQAEQTAPMNAVVADFNGDGRPDIAIVNPITRDVTVLLGQGDGTFRFSANYATVGKSESIAAGDLRGKGTLDLITTNRQSGTISVLLGNGDGTFEPERVFAAGPGATALVVGDFNSDGHVDVATANSGDNTVSILFGDGTGSFAAPVKYQLNVDLTASTNAPGIVTTQLARGSGTSGPQMSMSISQGPVALLKGDVSGDGTSALIVGTSSSFSVLKADKHGKFRLISNVPLDTVPSSFVAGDFNNDGKLDIVTANPAADPAKRGVSVLFGNGDGTFQAPVLFKTDIFPAALLAGPFNSIKQLDLAITDKNSSDVTVLAGQSNGTFMPKEPLNVGSNPISVTDVNGSALDKLFSNELKETIAVGLGLGPGSSVDLHKGHHPIRETPLLGDLGYGVAVAVLDVNGQILVRPGDPSAPGTFTPPLVLNPDATARARDLTLVKVNGRLELAAVGSKDNIMWFYTATGPRSFERSRGPMIPEDVPARILAADLDGDGRQDLVVTTRGKGVGHVYVYLQQADGTFGPPTYARKVGDGVTDVTLMNLTGGPLPDIVITDHHSGRITVLLHGSDSSEPFSKQLSFRAGTGLSSVKETVTPFQMSSHVNPFNFVAGSFASGGNQSLVVVDSATDRFSELVSDGYGGLFNPVSSPTYVTGPFPPGTPGAIVSGDFDGDGTLDLAILDTQSKQVFVYLGDGNGGFVPKYTTGPGGKPRGLDAGDSPGGLAAVDINRDGKLDLVIGSTKGDILILMGNGDGTFRPYQRADARHVALAVADVDKTGDPEFIVADQAHDLLKVEYDEPDLAVEHGHDDGVLHPNAVRVVDIDGDGTLDLVVANGGGNNVLVYLGHGDGTFDPALSFPVGTNPMGIAVADVDGDGTPDLIVANQGSNDISILLGQRTAADCDGCCCCCDDHAGHEKPTWTLIPGPRLHAGTGPVAVVAQDTDQDNLPEIFVANSQSNDVYLLKGIGDGFFKDNQPVIFPTGADPEALFVGHFENHAGLDLVTVNAGSNDLTYFSGLDPKRGRSISTDGLDPVAAIAGDFTHNGLTDLIVAHRGDNHITLLLAGPDGPRIAGMLAADNLPNISDLALGGVQDNGMSLFVTTEGSDAVNQLTFALGQNPDRQDDLVQPNAAEGTVVDLSTLPDLPLGLVVTLLLGSPSESVVASTSSGSNAEAELLADILLPLHPAPVKDSAASARERANVNAFITGAEEDQSLRENTPSEILPSALPQLFDFSDQPAARPQQSKKRVETGIPNQETQSVPLPIQSSPVESTPPEGSERSSVSDQETTQRPEERFFSEVDPGTCPPGSTYEGVSLGSIPTQLYGLTVLLAQERLATESSRKPRQPRLRR